MSSITGKLIQTKSGLWIREGTSDRYVEGTLREYKALSLKDEIVLDLGGHIGAFARKAMDAGAEYCLSVEPIPENCNLWEKNLQSYENVELLEQAVVSSEYDIEPGEPIVVSMHLSNGDTMAHTIDEVRGRNIVYVADADTLEHLLEDVKPSVVKIDIEGAEYSLMYDMEYLFPEFAVRYFACELHLNRKDQRQKAHKFVELMDKHYEQIVPVKIDLKNWNTTGVWRLRGIRN